MRSNSSKQAKKVVTIDFKNFKLHSLAKKYVSIYAEYGVETASIWSMDKLINKIEKKQFNNFVKEEMRKYGFNVLKKQQYPMDN